MGGSREQQRAKRRYKDQNVYILGHAGCSDGSASMYIAWRKFKDNAIYIPVQYNKPLPKMDLNKDTEIYILDFSYPSHVIVHLKSICKKVQIIDHHLSAYDDFIQDLAELYVGVKVCDGLVCKPVQIPRLDVSVSLIRFLLKRSQYFFRYVCRYFNLDIPIFDMNKSGALLTWEYFHPDQLLPDIIKYVSDRDLRAYRYPLTKAVMEGIFFSGLKDSFEYWDSLCYDRNVLQDCIDKGEHILKYKYNIISGYKRPGKFKVVLCDNHRVCVYNAIDFIDEIAEEFYSDKYLKIDLCISYVIESDGIAVSSLRTKVDGDVNLIPFAKFWGGGGHQYLAGATLDLPSTMKFLTWINTTESIV